MIEERVGIEDEGVESLAWEAGVLADGMRQQDLRRHVAFRAFELREHAARVRVPDAALKQTDFTDLTPPAPFLLVSPGSPRGQSDAL